MANTPTIKSLVPELTPHLVPHDEIPVETPPTGIFQSACHTLVLECEQPENRLGLTERYPFMFLVVTRMTDAAFLAKPLQTDMSIIVLESHLVLSRAEIIQNRQLNPIEGSHFVLNLWLAGDSDEEEYCIPISLLRRFVADNDNRPPLK